MQCKTHGEALRLAPLRIASDAETPVHAALRHEKPLTPS
jgi:hypothetical protein